MKKRKQFSRRRKTHFVLNKKGYLAFEENGKKMYLKEFHREGIHYVAPFSKTQARKIANIIGAFLIIK